MITNIGTTFWNGSWLIHKSDLMNRKIDFESAIGSIWTWVILNSTAAFKRLRIENAIDTTPVVGNVTIVPVRKSVIWTNPESFHGFGTLPLTINQS